MPSPSRTLSRRTLLQLSALPLSVGFGRAHAATPAPATAPRARSCILLYMAGGPSHIDTFDPKPGSAGGGPFRAIPTSVDGLRISEHLPRLAAAMKDIALIRSLTAKEGNHDRARHLMHTGYAPAGGVDHPAFGSLVADSRPAGPLPGYVAIGGPGADSGFLSAALSPFPVKNPEKPVKHLGRARNLDEDRFARRLSLWRQLEANFAAGRGGALAQARREVGEKAVTLMSAGVQAFDLGQEPETTRAAYGPNPFGAGCLMARRLVEAGVPFVEVTLNGWDTHEDNFARVKTLSQTLDQGMATLLADLTARGLLSSTLVVWMGDFGRTPRINERGGRDHYPAASSVLLAGGGIRAGQALGATDDAGAEVRDRAVTISDLYRTVAKLTGLDADRMRTSPAGRPIRAVDGGQLIGELLPA